MKLEEKVMLALYTQINDLVIMAIVKRGGRKYYKLVCSQGHSIEVRSDSLKEDRVCRECLKKIKRLSSLKRVPSVYEGYTKGQLKVLELLPSESYEHAKVLTLCTCGNIQEMFVTNLLKTTQSWSCGECPPYYQYVEGILHVFFEVGGCKSELLVDAEDAPLVLNSRWTVHRDTSNTYIRSLAEDRTFLHRLLTDCPDDMVVDHINGNGLDNRKCNLRVVNQTENARNTKLNKRNTSGKMGVTYREDTGKWRTVINGQDGQVVGLGSFSKKEDAIRKREEAEVFYGYHENHGRITQDTLDKG